MNTLNLRLKPLGLVALVLWSVLPARAQWSTQNIILQPGWNAVYLEVQPQPSDCDTALAGLSVEKVWGWNRKFSPVQFIQSATSLLPTQPDWLFYVPAANVLAPQRSLFHLEGGKCYLIKLPDHAAPATWQVLGQPTLRQIAWAPNSFNLVGFSLDLTNPPTFARFFSPSPAHANNPAYRLTSSGAWAAVTNLSATAMRSGEAFWIQCTGASTYQGPLALTVPQRTGLTYGQAAVQQNLSIQNLSANPATLIFTLLPSANPPAGSFAPLAGPVPLSYWSLGQATQAAAWLPLADAMTLSNLGAGQTTQWKWAVRRPDMIPNSPGSDAVYQSLLEIRDAAGSSRLVIPVSSSGLHASSVPLVQAGGQPSPSPAYPGLWIGTASINQVNQPGNATNPAQPTNTAAPFQFRLILHVDAATNVLFMQRVLEMWVNGTYTNSLAATYTNSSGIVTNTLSTRWVSVPGRYVLLTDESKTNVLAGLTGAALRDGQFVGRRVSTAAFGFRSPIPMTNPSGGDFGVASSVYTCTVPLPPGDPLNPFRHLYHPEHSNTNTAPNNPLLPVGVSRTITLTFTATDPNSLALAGWGDNQIGGLYQETITGLQWQTNFVQGTFRLTQASPLTGLDGNP